MKKHTKKIIAPVIITVLLVLFLLGYAILATISIVGIIFAVTAVIGIALAIYTLIERIHEIKDGEEDDISKY
ncbi:MAG: hypothetical protein MR503_02705 [Oscillospiraceae bacterium]|nr:hypothetical protein [Oscillospiraceae bacterium]